jgi:uncharacterized Zn-finger protein
MRALKIPTRTTPSAMSFQSTEPNENEKGKDAIFYRHPRFWVEIFHAAVAAGVYVTCPYEQGTMFVGATAVGILVGRTLYHVFLVHKEHPIIINTHINHGLKEHVIRKRLYLGKEVALSPRRATSSVSLAFH